MQYSIFAVSPENYPHSTCFSELADCLNAALVSLGHQSQVVTSPAKILGRPVVLGAHLLNRLSEGRLPDEAVVFNTEQIGEGFGSEEWYLSLLSKTEVWDYSPLNIVALKAKGVEAKLCEIGYMPVLMDLPSVHQDIDIVFCGSVNDRRQKILSDLKTAGCGIVPITGYGSWRNKYLARAKIILNVHYYDSKIFEIVRCSHMMANSKTIVSEIGLDKKLESPYEEGVAFAPYDGLVDRCVTLLKDKEKREHVGRLGFEIFSAKNQANILEKLVGKA